MSCRGQPFMLLGRRDLWHIITEVNDVSVLMFFPGSFLVKNDGESFLWRYSPLLRAPCPPLELMCHPRKIAMQYL